MKVIIIEDVESIGRIGDEKVVKEGYARNYLIPQKIAIEATPGALKVLEQKKRIKARKEQQLKEECLKLAEELQKASCTISMEAGEEDKLFGAVTSEMIAEVFKAEGIEIDKRKIVLEEPIKALGTYNVEIRLHPEVLAQVRVWVVKK